jgi:hypothetical protein
MGGNSKLYLNNRLEDPFTATGGEATAMNVALTAAYSYELEGDNNTLEQVVVGDENTGTRVCTQTLTVSLKGMAPADNAEFNLLCASMAQAVIKTRNGEYISLGEFDGMRWTVTAATGGAHSDFTGYTVVGVARTNRLGLVLDATTITAFEAVEVAVV